MSAEVGSKSIKWVEGLRGIASFLVILTHLARAWDFELFFPTDWDQETKRPRENPRILQLPILRIPWQGRIGVTIFAFLTGFVCALKPLKLARQSNYNAANTSIGKSAFRRAPRLILPATIAMCCAWTLAQLGAFSVANRSDSNWIRYASPDLLPTLSEELKRLFTNFRTTWTTGYMAYDDHQWALLPLLKGSFIVYVTLFATMRARFHYRLLFYVLMYMYFHQNNHVDTETFGMQMFYGLFLADLTLSPTIQHALSRNRLLVNVVSPPLIIFGLYLASFPDGDADRINSRPWSAQLLRVSSYIFPPDVNLGKRWTALGVDIVIFGIWLSPTLKDVLSCRLLLYLGKNSFAVYLTHGTLLRTVLVWILYGIFSDAGNVFVDNEGVARVDHLHPKGPWAFVFGIPAWLIVVYTVAHVWTEHVDSWCDRVVRGLEDRIFQEEEKNGDFLLA